MKNSQNRVYINDERGGAFAVGLQPAGRPEGRPRYVHRPGQPGQVQQHFADSCDINNIVKQFLKTGTLPESNFQPISGDFTSIDFHAMQNRAAAAKSDFMALPSHIRDRFQNDVSKLSDFLQNPDNHDEAVKLGLLHRNPVPPAPEPTPTPAAASAAPQPASPATEGNP